LIYGSVCSGIEAASVAWRPLGWSPAWFSEIAPFPSAVLAHHYPDVPNLGDANKVHEKPEFKAHKLDILVGGTPCQSFSQAGGREGFGDPRGRLALRFLEIAEMRRPRWLVWENVPDVLSSNGGKDFGALLWKMGNLGYGYSWHVLDARDFGLAQSRRRVFLVGHIGGQWKRAAAVFSDLESVQGNPEAGRDVAAERGRAGAEVSGTNRTRAFALKGNAIHRRPGVGSQGIAVREGLMYCVTKSHRHAVIADGVARYVLPVEAERLQGLPDNYTKVPYRGQPAQQCPDALRYEAVGNSMPVPVMRWVGERMKFVDSLPDDRVTFFLPPDDLARTLTDSELIARCVQGFRKLKEIIPYLREARDRFAQPGRRVPIPGNPTWTEWVEQNLGVTVRTVQRLLREGSEPHGKMSRGQKPSSRLAKGDWRRLLKVTENRMAQVFGPLEDQHDLAGAIRRFAQGIADRYSRPSGKLVVSVAIKSRK
jgi:DNA (cytosine-5)-methyltransferase 1